MSLSKHPKCHPCQRMIIYMKGPFGVSSSRKCVKAIEYRPLGDLTVDKIDNTVIKQADSRVMILNNATVATLVDSGAVSARRRTAELPA